MPKGVVRALWLTAALVAVVPAQPDAATIPARRATARAKPAATAPAAAIADTVIPARQQPAPREADPADRALYERLSSLSMAAFDSVRGGFVRKDGTPCEAAIELAIVRGREGDSLAARRAAYTLRWMRMLVDTVGGGYVTGMRDRDPSHPHFEKLTAPNARRLELLAMAPDGLNGDERRIVDYFERVLIDPRGGFLNGQGGSQDLEPESNGLALQAWWRMGVRAEEPKRRAFAFLSTERVWASCRDEELGMVRRDTWGKMRDPSLLADQAEMGRALLFAWQAAGRDTDLVRARGLALHIAARFEDDSKGGFRVEFAEDRFGHTRRSPRPFEDNARTARFLVELGVAADEPVYVRTARRAWGAFTKQFEKPRLETAEWALAVRATWANDGPVRSTWGEKPAPRPVPAAKPAKAKPTRSAKPKR